MTIQEWKEACPIRKAVKELDITLADFASSIGVSSNTIYQWCSGGFMPGIGYIRKIEDELGVTVEDLDNWRKARPKGDGANV